MDIKGSFIQLLTLNDSPLGKFIPIENQGYVYKINKEKLVRTGNIHKIYIKPLDTKCIDFFEIEGNVEVEDIEYIQLRCCRRILMNIPASLLNLLGYISKSNKISMKMPKNAFFEKEINTIVTHFNRLEIYVKINNDVDCDISMISKDKLMSNDKRKDLLHNFNTKIRSFVELENNCNCANVEIPESHLIQGFIVKTDASCKHIKIEINDRTLIDYDDYALSLYSKTLSTNNTMFYLPINVNDINNLWSWDHSSVYINVNKSNFSFTTSENVEYIKVYVIILDELVYEKDTLINKKPEHIRNDDVWKIVKNKLDQTTECNILFSEIKIGDFYVICSVCKKTMSYNGFIKWHEIKNNCPNCRSIWNNYIKYKNA